MAESVGVIRDADGIMRLVVEGRDVLSFHEGSRIDIGMNGHQFRWDGRVAVLDGRQVPVGPRVAN